MARLRRGQIGRGVDVSRFVERFHCACADCLRESQHRVAAVAFEDGADGSGGAGGPQADDGLVGEIGRGGGEQDSQIFGQPERIDPAPAYLADQPVIGLWPASAAVTVSAILESDGRHSMLAFAEAIGARAVKSLHKPANINTPADLAAAETRHRL